MKLGLLSYCVLSDFGENFALDRSEASMFHGLLMVQSFYDVREIICFVFVMQLQLT